MDETYIIQCTRATVQAHASMTLCRTNWTQFHTPPYIPHLCLWYTYLHIISNPHLSPDPQPPIKLHHLPPSIESSPPDHHPPPMVEGLDVQTTTSSPSSGSSMLVLRFASTVGWTFFPSSLRTTGGSLLASFFSPSSTAASLSCSSLTASSAA